MIYSFSKKIIFVDIILKCYDFLKLSQKIFFHVGNVPFNMWQILLCQHMWCGRVAALFCHVSQSGMTQIVKFVKKKLQTLLLLKY